MNDDRQDECLKILSNWIVKYKGKTWIKHVTTNDDASQLQSYKDTLEEMEKRLKDAIYKEDTETLKALGLPDELMECIKDMCMRAELCDMLYESLVTHHFNRSPGHEEELNNENSGLR